MTESIGSVIIVGGGPGGVHVAKSIAKACGASVKITIVDRQNYLDWSLASPRSLVQPDDVEKFGYAMPLDKVCEFIAGKHGKIKFVQGVVTNIGTTSVTLDNGTVLKAKAIVIAVGGQYAGGGPWKPLPDQTTKETRVAGFRTLREQLEKANHILVAGAGLTGVEVAGELKAAFPSTTVTIVGSMLPNFPEALQTRMKTALEGMDIVVMEGRVDANEPDGNGNVQTRSGETIEKVDVVLNATGFSFKGKDLADSALQADVTDRGQFQCKPTLQVSSVDTVFCCGDILAVPEGHYADVKGVFHAEETAETVAKNVVALLQSKPLTEFKWSKVPILKPMMTALGPSVGVGFVGLPFECMENFLCRSLKCKDYYMGHKKSDYGKGKTW